MTCSPVAAAALLMSWSLGGPPQDFVAPWISAAPGLAIRMQGLLPPTARSSGSRATKPREESQSGGARTADRSLEKRPEQLNLPSREFVPPRIGEEISRHVLSTGTVVWVVPDPSVPLVDFAVALRLDYRDDPPARPGLTAFMVDLMRRGGAGNRTADEFDQAVAELGAILEGRGGTRGGEMSLTCLPRQLDRCLSLLQDVLLVPRFEPARLATARDNIMASIRLRQDDPLGVLAKTWSELIYGADHPLGRSLSAADVEKFTEPALRTLHQRVFSPEALVIGVSGAVESSDVVARLERQLASSWPPSTGSGRATPAAPPVIPVAAPGLYVVPWALSQGKMIVGHRGLDRNSWQDRDADVALLLGEVLAGNGSVSRLRSRLRSVEGLVYRLNSSFGIGWGEPGVFEVFLELRPAGALQAIESIQAEMRRLRDEPVSEAELSLARASLRASIPTRFDGAVAVALQFLDDELVGRPAGYWEDLPRRLERVSASAVQRAARKLLHPEDLRALWVGPEVDAALARRLMGRVVTLER